MSKSNKSVLSNILGNKKPRDSFPGYDESVRIVVQKDVTNLVQKAKAYFYINNVKNVQLETLSLEHYLQEVDRLYVVTTQQKEILIRGMRTEVNKLLNASFTAENVVEKQVMDKNYKYIVTFINASYNKKMKQKELGVIKQDEVRVATSIRLNADLKHDVQEYAKQRHTTLTSLIENALRKEIYESDDEGITL